MKTKTVEICFCTIFIGLVLSFFVALYVGISNSPSNSEIEAVRIKYGCTPTNDFVGKDAERLYLCSNGYKYVYHTFYSWAYEEKKNK